MTYRELYEKATRQLEKSEITLGEYEEITKPLDEEIRKKGKWIGDKAYPICPKCNCNIIEEYISCSDYAEMYKPMKYCPNCATEMENDK